MKDKLLAIPTGLLDAIAELMKSPKKLLLMGLAAVIVWQLVSAGQSNVVDYGVTKISELVSIAAGQLKENGLAIAALVGVYYLLKK